MTANVGLAASAVASPSVMVPQVIENRRIVRLACALDRGVAVALVVMFVQDEIHNVVVSPGRCFVQTFFEVFGSPLECGFCEEPFSLGGREQEALVDVFLDTLQKRDAVCDVVGHVLFG